jgi:hypothetical protein
MTMFKNLYQLFLDYLSNYNLLYILCKKYSVKQLIPQSIIA